VWSERGRAGDGYHAPGGVCDEAADTLELLRRHRSRGTRVNIQHNGCQTPHPFRETEEERFQVCPQQPQPSKAEERHETTAKFIGVRVCCVNPGETNGGPTFPECTYTVYRALLGGCLPGRGGISCAAPDVPAGGGIIGINEARSQISSGAGGSAID